ncbi:MAG: hypothetical protein AAF433_18825 [Bacteroidota bacterium]
MQQVYAEALQAYESADHPTFLARMLQADSLRPNHPTILYNLAAAYSLNGQSAEAIYVLERSIWQNGEVDFEADEDFVSLRERPSYQELVAFAQDYRAEVRNSQLAFELEDAGFHPEGVAVDPASGDFFLGSVRHRNIIRYHSDGSQSSFCDDPRLWSVMGLQVDSKRGLLWATTVPAPQMIGYQDSLANRSALVGMDLVSGEVLHYYELEAEGAWLGDLALAADGTIYCSSSSAPHPAIYRLRPSAGELEEFIHLEALVSLQGLCLGPQEKQLYFSDYRYGLFSLELASQEVYPLENSTPHPLKGIDGLYYYNGQLIGLHNGLRPFQLTAYELSREGKTIISFAYLDKALAEMGEPTLGVITADEFYYLANSPWGAYDREGNFLEDRAKAPLVFKLNLAEIFNAGE